MSTTNVIKAASSGPITVDLRLVAGLVEVTVQDCQRAQVELSTSDGNGPAADAVRKPTVVDSAAQLRVDATVRGNAVHGGGMHGGIQVNNFGGVQVAGNVYGDVIQVGGVRYGSMHSCGPSHSISPIIARVVLPTGSSLVVDATSADVLVRGPLGKAQVETVSGRIELGLVRDLHAETVNGSISIGELAGDGYAKTVSGSVVVHAGGPHRLTAETISGNITAPHPIRLDGRSVSGRVRNY